MIPSSLSQGGQRRTHPVPLLKGPAYAITGGAFHVPGKVRTALPGGRPRLSRPELARRHAWHPPTTGRTGGQRLCAEIRESSGPPVAQGGVEWETGLVTYPGKKRTRRVEDRRARERRREISYRTISLRLAGWLCPPTVTVNTTHLGKMMGLSVNSLRTRPPGGKATQTQGQRPESLVRLVKEHRA